MSDVQTLDKSGGWQYNIACDKKTALFIKRAKRTRGAELLKLAETELISSEPLLPEPDNAGVGRFLLCWRKNFSAPVSGCGVCFFSGASGRS
jgi:hypothetical protein